MSSIVVAKLVRKPCECCVLYENASSCCEATLGLRVQMIPRAGHGRSIRRALSGKFVGLDQPPTLVARALPLAEFTATRVRWSDSGSGTPSRFNRNNGYLVCLQRRDLLAGPYCGWPVYAPMPINSGSSRCSISTRSTRL